jgi:ubiquinone/menaquinone biosynthesis C-methylase UbiE
MERDPKELVRTGYDACGLRYNRSREIEPCPELDILIESLPAKAEVLDIGCGGGRPITTVLARHASITGVDISSVQIAEARKVLPDARLIAGDIVALDFDDASFDAIVSFYTLIHLPRDEHQPLLERIARWLKPRGYLLITVGRTDTPSYTERDFYGVTMFWSHFDTSWYRAAVESLGLEVLQQGVVGLPSEHHPILLARAAVG